MKTTIEKTVIYEIKDSGFNPNAKAFLDKHEPSLLGFMWAMQWRMSLMIITIYFALVVVIFSLAALFS